MCQFLATLTVGKSNFSEDRFWSIFVIFRYFRVKIVTIRRRASIFSRATRFVVVLPPPGRAARFFISAFVATALETGQNTAFGAFPVYVGATMISGFVATALIWASWATSARKGLQEA